ncbi:MAG TPA: ABC transporter ATP-binding protein [Kofleriaceae bacterium]|nr:ABC transporter ATP-binding protein [Kofleriaceae bacterium]
MTHERASERANERASGPRIELAGVIHRFGDRAALAGLSIQVAAGEIYGLVGPDGAGKTTALRIAAGLIRPGAGQVRLAGQDPLDARSTSRERLGYMPQQYSLYGDLTVAENLAFFREMYGLSRPAFRARRDRLLALTRLAAFGDRRAQALSGGMYKKLALACALLHEPEVLLLDEPTTGVDPISRRELWDLLHELLAEGIAIVLTTPYMDEAARCHRAGLLYQGALLVEGTPAALLAAFPHAVVTLEGDRDVLEELLVRDPDVLAFTPAGAQLRVVLRRGRDGAVNGAVIERLAAAGARAGPATATFEDVFLASVRERAASVPGGVAGGVA